MIHGPKQANQLTKGKWLPLLFLPGHLNVTLDNPTVDQPCIKVLPSHASHWQQNLTAEKLPIIGIC